MVRLCEHAFEAEDPQHPDYSLTESDLFPAVGGDQHSLSIRENKRDEVYEIFDFEYDPDPYRDEAVHFESEELRKVLEYANRLEEKATGSSSFEYGHDPSVRPCPEYLRKEY